MNVLQVTNTLHKGGAEAHLLDLATGLRAQGVTCEVAFLRVNVPGGSDDLRPAFEDAGIRTHYLRCDRSYDARAPIRLHRLLDTRNWDILHSHLPRSDAAAAVCRGLDSDQTWISTLHHPYDSPDNAYSARRWVPAMAPMWRLADGVIAVSDAVRQWSIQRLGLTPGRVRTIVHGIDVEGRIDRTSVNRTEASPATGLRIGAIGRYEERKGHETLIRAMVHILREFPDAELRIAGHDPGGYGDVLRSLIAELNLEPHVHLVGFVSDTRGFLSDIDVFAFASRSEGFGIVLLEAMAAGKPVVVSDIAPMNSIIGPGSSGLVAACGDPAGFAAVIMSLFRDPAYRRQIGEEGRRRVTAEFSQRAMVDRTLDYYREVLASR